MANVTLYKGYRGSRNVLNDLPSTSYDLECRFDKLTSNLAHIIIDNSLINIINYNYIKIDADLTNRDYDEYYFIDSLEYLNQNKVKVNISLDYLRTFKDVEFKHSISAVNRDNNSTDSTLQRSYKLVGSCVETPINTNMKYTRSDDGLLTKDEYNFIKSHFRTYLVICNDFLTTRDGVKVYHEEDYLDRFQLTTEENTSEPFFSNSKVKGRLYYLFNVYNGNFEPDIKYNKWNACFPPNYETSTIGESSTYTTYQFDSFISKFMISGNPNNVVERVVCLDGLGRFEKIDGKIMHNFHSYIKEKHKRRVILASDNWDVAVYKIFGVLIETDFIEQDLTDYFYKPLEIKGNKPAVNVLKYKDLEIPLKMPYYLRYNMWTLERNRFKDFGSYNDSGFFKRTIFLQPNPKEKITIQYFNHDNENEASRKIIENNVEEYWTDVNYDFPISSSVIDSHLSVNEKMYQLEKQKMEREMDLNLQQIKRDRTTNSIGLGLDIGSSLLSLGSAISGNVVAAGQLGGAIGGTANSVMNRVNQYENLKRKESDIHYEIEYQKEKREIELDNLRKQGNIIKGDTYETDEMSCFRPVILTIHLTRNDMYSENYPLYESSIPYTTASTIQNLLDIHKGFKGRIIYEDSYNFSENKVVNNRHDINELNEILKIGVHSYNEIDRSVYE